MANDDTVYFQFPGDKFLQKLEDGTPLRGHAYQLCGTDYNVVKLDLEVDYLKRAQEKKKGNAKEEVRPNNYEEFDRKMNQLEKKLAIVKKRLCKYAKAPVICEPPQEEEEGGDEEEEPAEEAAPAEEDEC